MRTCFGKLGSITAVLAVVGVVWSAAALAQATRFTQLQGTVGANGTWGRTILDGPQPNEPNGKTQATYTINTPYLSGWTSAQLAAAYQAAAIAALPAAPNSSIGYGAVTENSVNPTIRLGRQTGFWSITGGETGLPAGITMNNFLPTNAQHAPAVSPAGLMALAASMSAMAWWARRRRIAV